MSNPNVTVVVPSFNQGKFLDKALSSIFEQNVIVEVFVLDGGSNDNSVEIIKKWSSKLAGWRSHADAGQAAAINEGIERGTAPYVCWLNSDDWFLPGGLQKMLDIMELHSSAPAVYGRVFNFDEKTKKQYPVWVEPFNERRLALRSIISQPGTLIRRSSWEALGGLDVSLHLAMDYDLWWRLYKLAGPLQFIDGFLAVNREHDATKTKTQRFSHYKEAIKVVKKHYGSVPLKWWLAQPYAVWYKSLKVAQRR